MDRIARRPARWAGPLLLALAGAAPGDVVYLKGGHEVEGKVLKEERHTVLVETLAGIHSIPRSRIEKIRRCPWDVETLRARQARLARSRSPKEAEELFRWATASERCAKLEPLLEELCRLVVEVAPDHLEARLRLGHQQVDGRWLPAAEAKALLARREEERARAAAEELARSDAALAEKMRHAARYGGAPLEEQIAAEAGPDAADAAELARVLGVPAVTVVSSWRLTVRGFLTRREAVALLEVGERALARWGEELFGLVAFNPFTARRIKFHYYAVDAASLPAAIELVARGHGGVSAGDRAFFARWGLGVPANGFDQLCVRPLELDPQGLVEPFLRALARAWAEAASGARLAPWLPEGFAVEAVRRVLGASPAVRTELCLEGRPLAFADGVRWDWLARTLGRIQADPPLRQVLVRSPQELTLFETAKAAGIVAMLWDHEPRRLGLFIRELGYKHGTQLKAVRQVLDLDPEGVDALFRRWAAGKG